MNTSNLRRRYRFASPLRLRYVLHSKGVSWNQIGRYGFDSKGKKRVTGMPLPGTSVRGSKSGAPIMALLDLLGRRWSMGVLWTLCQGGPATFRDLQKRCETISPAVLNSRLKELRQARFVDRSPEGYVATELGQELFGHLNPLGAWAKLWARALKR